MRVVINAMAVTEWRTGVGHYTVELIAALRRGKQVKVNVYPHPLMAKLRLQLGGGPKAATPANGSNVPHRSLLRRTVRTPFRWGWRALVETELRHSFHPKRVDIYHEPNFFPFVSRVPTVVTVHDLSAVLHPEWHPAERAKQFSEEFLPRISAYAHILTDSDAARDEIIRTLDLPRDRVTRAYPGIRKALHPMSPADVESARTRLGLPPKYFLHVGTLEPRKNLLMLLRAYTSLPAVLRESCPLLLAGPWGWRFEELAEYYESHAKHHNVRHLGYVEESDLPALYNGARALVFPTYYEGFGLPAAEMLACGGAVIASATPAVAEVLGGCGTLIDPTAGDGWREAMSRAITDDQWIKDLRAGGVERAAEFTWANCARDTFSGYRAAAAL